MCEDVTERASNELVRLLLENGRNSGVAVLIGSLLMAPVLLGAASPGAYAIWFGYMSLLALVRMGAVRFFFTHPASAFYLG